MFVKINGERHDLCRAVDHGDEILEADGCGAPRQESCIEIPRENDVSLRSAAGYRNGPAPPYGASLKELAAEAL